MCEFWNSLSSVVYVVAGSTGLVRREVRQDPVLLICWLSLAMIGVGSATFHATMLYKYELLDEVPMLLLVCALMCTMRGCHPLLRSRWRQVLLVAFATLVLVACLAAYVALQVYEIFVHGFTAIIAIDLALMYTWDAKHGPTSQLRNACITSLVVARVAWEVERNVCVSGGSTGWLWGLHPVWHLLSCAGGYYALVATQWSRQEAGLGPAPSASLWPLVPLVPPAFGRKAA